MSIDSLTFLYLFLPASLIIYNLTPKKFKSAALTFISAIFFALWEFELFAVLSIDVILCRFISEAMKKAVDDPKKKKFLLTAAIIINVMIILGFSLKSQLAGGFAPFAAMVIAFTAIGYFVDVNKNETEYISSFWDFSVFFGFFGKLARGPLIRTKTVSALPENSGFSLTETGNGLYLFIQGLAKYVVLGIPLVKIHESLVIANQNELSVLGAWIDMVVFSMMIFFDLSGFCDMARGLGKCFGMELPKNFYFPFQSPSVGDFLDRLNMTVTAFFRHYVYDVLRNDKNSKPQFIVNTLLICMLCGVWFGIEMNFIFWGLYIAAFIIIEELFLNKILEKIPHIFARIYTFCVTMFSMTIFSAESVSSIIPTFKAMFGAVPATITNEVYYIISQNVLVLLLGAFFLLSAFSMFVRYLNKKSSALFSLVAFTESAILLLLITANLI